MEFFDFFVFSVVVVGIVCIFEVEGFYIVLYFKDFVGFIVWFFVEMVIIFICIGIFVCCFFYKCVF